MTRKQRTARTHALLYQIIQQAIDSGFVGDEATGDETERDMVAFEKGLDRWSQFHFNRSDLATPEARD